MSLLKKRYFVWISLIYLGFSAMLYSSDGYEIFILSALSAAVFTVILAQKRKKSRNFKTLLALAIAVSLLAALNVARERLTLGYIYESYSGVHTVEGYVKEMPSKQDHFSEHAVHIEYIDGERVSLDCVLVAEYSTELSRGDFFKTDVTLIPLSEYEELEYLKNKDPYEHALAAVLADGTEITYLDPSFRLPLMLARLNSRLSGYLKHHIGGHSGELASALLLGNRALLRDEVVRDFRLAGVYHMLALSGQHVAILVGILEFLLRRMRVGKCARVVILGALTLFYIALTGFLLSACRAMLMLWAVYLSFLFGKRSDSLTSLFAAVGFIVLIRPSAVTDVGLQLSFLSTLGVICAMMLKERIFLFRGEIRGGELQVRLVKLGRELLTLLLISLCALIATLPVIMINFGELSLASLISNLFMGALCEIFMILSLISLVLTGTGALCSFFGDAARLAGDLMTDIIGTVADIDGAVISLRYPFAPILVWGLFISVIVMLCVELEKKRLLGIVPACFALLFCVNMLAYGAYRSDFVRTEFIKGDCLVISSAEGVYLCDVSNGRMDALFLGTRAAKENCKTSIDGVILTHYHSYHIRTLEKLANTQKLGRVLLPYPRTEKEASIMSSIFRVLEGKGVQLIIYREDEPIDLLGGELTVSERVYVHGYSHPSVALSYSFGEDRITLVERPYFDTYLEEKGSFEPYIKDSDVLIFGSDGRTPSASFEIFSCLSTDTEVYFTDFELMELSDYEDYLGTHKVFFDVEYKKYDLK